MAQNTIEEWLDKLDKEQKQYTQFYTMKSGEQADIEILDIEERLFTMKDGKQRKRYLIHAKLIYSNMQKEKSGEEITIVFGRKSLVNLLTMLKLQGKKDFRGERVRIIRVGEGLDTVYNFAPLLS